MLEMIVSVGSTAFESQTRAKDLYNALEVRRSFNAVQTIQGHVPDGTFVWITTIWYNVLGEPVKPKQEEKFEFLGSTGIDPKDPDWYEKWKTLQENATEESENTMAHIADH